MRVYEVTDDVPVTEVYFSDILVKNSATINEALDFTASAIADSNLDKLCLNEIPGNVQYEPSVLDRLVQKSQHLTNLSIRPKKER